MKKIFIIAGEASGDFHSSALVHKLRDINPNIEFSGIGGNFLKKEGIDLLFHYDEVNFIGFTAVLKNLSHIKAKIRETVDKIKDLNPDMVILVDFPGYNLKVAELIRKFYKRKIVYYISPQVWAWHRSRVKKIQKYIDEMLVVFPFEVEFYGKENVRAEFVGHPLVERINTFLDNNKRESTSNTITLLPGSRKEEIQRMLPELLEVAKSLKKDRDLKINVISPSNLNKDFYSGMISGYDVDLIKDDKNKDSYYKAILNSDLVITKAGTPTMECTLLGTPFIVVYRAGKLNYLIGKSMIQVDYTAMPNILLQKEAVKEFIQNEMNTDNIYSEAVKILDDNTYRENMLDELKQVRALLTDESASGNAASIINSLLEK